MYFSRARFKADVTPDREWMVENLYQSHKTIWRLFAGEHKENRNYLFREIDSNYNALEFYIVSADKPIDKNGYWHLETKQYLPVITNQDQFYFSLRVNPVITKTDPGSGKKSRHDVVMNLKKEWKTKHGQSPTGAHFQKLIHEAGADWLSSRSESNGFWINREKLIVSRYFQQKIEKKHQENDFSKYSDKKKASGTLEIKFSTLDLEGILKVVDPKAVKNSLFKGIGPSKAFGCGLLLLKRI